VVQEIGISSGSPPIARRPEGTSRFLENLRSGRLEYDTITAAEPLTFGVPRE
jgi:hypothetical protein